MIPTGIGPHTLIMIGTERSLLGLIINTVQALLGSITMIKTEL